jgi:acyl-coenzyme A thioesterase PaaI-like protein
VRSHGLVAMTRHMEVDYQRPVPSTEEIRLEGRVTRNEGRKHWVEANILNSRGNVLAHGKGLFIEVRPAPDPDPVKDGPTPHG